MKDPSAVPAAADTRKGSMRHATFLGEREKATEEIPQPCRKRTLDLSSRGRMTICFPVRGRGSEGEGSQRKDKLLMIKESPVSGGASDAFSKGWRGSDIPLWGPCGL